MRTGSCALNLQADGVLQDDLTCLFFYLSGFIESSVACVCAVFMHVISLTYRYMYVLYVVCVLCALKLPTSVKEEGACLVPVFHSSLPVSLSVSLMLLFLSTFICRLVALVLLLSQSFLNCNTSLFLHSLVEIINFNASPLHYFRADKIILQG